MQLTLQLELGNYVDCVELNGCYVSMFVNESM
jgi:hypothetical protein